MPTWEEVERALAEEEREAGSRPRAVLLGGLREAYRVALDEHGRLRNDPRATPELLTAKYYEMMKLRGELMKHRDWDYARDVPLGSRDHQGDQ